MACKPVKEVDIIDVEEIEWVTYPDVGVIVGRKNSGIRELKDETGAEVKFIENRCMISGRPDALEQAKICILEKIKVRLCEKGNSVLSRSIPKNLSDMKDENWESLSIPSKYFKQIVGKGLQTKYGVNIRLRSFNRKYFIVIRGEEEAKKNLKKWMEEYIELQMDELLDSNENQVNDNINRKSFVSKDAHDATKEKKDFHLPNKRKEKTSTRKHRCIIENIDPQYFGRIIGKGGSKMRYLNEKHNVKIYMKDEKIYITGSKNDCNAAKVDIELLTSNEKKVTSGKSLKGSERNTYFIGIGEEEEVSLSVSEYFVENKYCKISNYPETVCAAKRYDNILGLKEALADSFERVKMETEKNDGALCNIVIHFGMMYYKYEPGTYQISTLRSSVQNNVYERFYPHQIDFDRLNKLPILSSYVRIDMSISTPEIFSIRYKVFAKVIKCKVLYIDIQEAGVAAGEMLNFRLGPGYFCHPEQSIARSDIIDLSSNFTTRLNISFFKHDEAIENKIIRHANVLKDFFNNIVIKYVFGNNRLFLPVLEEDYKITYLRFCERSRYKFGDGNILRTSKEKIIFKGDCNNNVSSSASGYDVTLSNANGWDADVIDVFVTNEILDEMLLRQEWCTDRLLNALENALEFSDTMMEYML